jgi:putative peptidoglycan lipid II flippase
VSGIGRASVVIGAGTLVSRITGFLRVVVLVSAIGAVGSRAGDAFATANQLPNDIFQIISTGILTAVLVPQIVKAAAAADGGRAFLSKLFTLGAVVLLATTAVAMVAAPWLITLFAPDYPPEQRALAVAFAYWCLPQILFYGLYAIVGEALNARNIFGPFTWAPIVNNLVSIAGFGAFIVLFGGPATVVTDWTPAMVALIGGTATFGIAVQAAILLLFWRRTGLRVRPDFRWRGVGLGQIGRLAGWTFLMVIAAQVAGLVQSRVLSAASGDGPAAFAIQNAWLLFMLPYSLIVISIGTPYFTRLSEHAAAGRTDDVRSDLVTSVRILGFFVVVATAALAAAAVPASRIFTDSADDAREAAAVLLCYLVSLVPLAVLFVVQRTFYAYDDTRTPFLFTLLQTVIIIALTYAVGAFVDVERLAAAIALVQSVATIVQVVVATWLLERRVGRTGVHVWVRSLVRFAVAAVPAGLAGWGVYLLFGGDAGWMAAEKLLGALGAAVIGIVTVVVYLLVLWLMRSPELRPAIAVVRRRLGR